MRTLLIDEKGVMYLAGTKDFYDLKFSRRRKASILPTLDQTDKASVPRDEWKNREYVDFICNVEANSRKYKKAKMKKGGRTVNAYGYLQELRKNYWNVAAQIEGHMYIIPIEDAIEFTLGLVESYELAIRFVSQARCADHYGINNYLIVV
ncbi:hypothetical protein BD26P3_00046 [Phocaeicola phage BD26P3]|nr:hypothetical protein BD26P1_00039 [Phocaeicola phage BD26P1]WAX06071.1 hypothetical protein BD26P2_00024 [Phocaeicola phage BD26P2]WAX06142.1 hypothetical protein BD26P3_00046 [Phocaeicola phage BD26P3]WAX06168.1 hypothetical protein BD26P4_00024 [Phocaeicola phage BD26P4]WAX06240.1 hypothetical protein BD26P5_00047 [Phocaeicola phage BD26P5]